MQCSGDLLRTPRSVLESGPPVSKKSLLLKNHQPGRLAFQHDALLVIGCDWHAQLSKLSQAHPSSTSNARSTYPSPTRASNLSRTLHRVLPLRDFQNELDRETPEMVVFLSMIDVWIY